MPLADNEIIVIERTTSGAMGLTQAQFAALVNELIPIPSAQLVNTYNNADTAISVAQDAPQGEAVRVGPTGSGENVIWSDLDAVPTTATQIEIVARVTGETDGSGDPYTVDLQIVSTVQDFIGLQDSAINFAGTAPASMEPVVVSGRIRIPLVVPTKSFKFLWSTSGLTVTSASQVVDVGGDKVAGTATGLANDTTEYEFFYDGNLFFVVGQDCQTFGDLVTQLDLVLTGIATTDLAGGNLNFYTNATGAAASIDLADITLFAALAGFVAINPANDGTGPALVLDWHYYTAPEA